MLFPIIKIEDINWFKKCVGCQDFGSANRVKKCTDCSKCPYSRCGSHEDKYIKSEAFCKVGVE